jgi:hypothetical protein
MMRRLRIFGVVLLGVFVLGVCVSGSASAVALPEFSVETNATGTNGESKVNLTGIEFECTSGADTLKAVSKSLGKFTIEFTGCELVAEECHSEVSATEKTTAKIILLGGEYHLVRGASGRVFVWFLIPAQTVKCKHGATLIGLVGSLLGLITPILTTTKSYEVGINVVGTAKSQEWTEYENDSGVKVAVSFKAKIGSGTLKNATLELADNKYSMVSATEIIKTT